MSAASCTDSDCSQQEEFPPKQQQQQEKDVCWVCMEEPTDRKPLSCPCQCPRPVHLTCLARWQLHSAGTSEETVCRFCKGELPDWKQVLRPTHRDLSAAPSPTMSVTFNGRVHHVTVQGGPGGYEAFIRDIRTIFGITEDHDMHLAFDCADPVSGNLVKLNGSGAYHAAVHCAAVSAAKRVRQSGKRRRHMPARSLRQSGFAVADSATSMDMGLPSYSPSAPPLEARPPADLCPPSDAEPVGLQTLAAIAADPRLQEAMGGGLDFGALPTPHHIPGISRTAARGSRAFPIHPPTDIWGSGRAQA